MFRQTAGVCFNPVLSCISGRRFPQLQKLCDSVGESHATDLTGARSRVRAHARRTADDDVGGADGSAPCEVVRLGAIRVGADYAYALKLRNPTPYARRFRVLAAGWDDTPAAPRATLHVRYKALALAPGLSAALTLVFTHRLLVPLVAAE